MSFHEKLAITAKGFLVGHHIQLEPIANNHREALQIAADDERIWRYMSHKAMKERFILWFDESLKKMNSGEQFTYVVRNKANQAILGATAFYDIHLQHQRLGLGYTWFIPEVWGSVVNPESKLLMLTQAFECYGVNRVEIGTDSRNIHSYNAIKKLGATEEGRLRQHMILHDGALTDTIVFSIVSPEWIIIKHQLIQRLIR